MNTLTLHACVYTQLSLQRLICNVSGQMGIIGQRHGRLILMCQSVPSYRLLPIGTYEPMIT